VFEDNDYLDRKQFWDAVLDMLGPRDTSIEEAEAFMNALEERLAQIECE
jgi:hypothetical protein